MIHGIGTDIVQIERVQRSLDRHGARFAARILAASERDGFAASRDPARFLAKRFAAKEAFGKALGTGVAIPATLHAVAVDHDERGKPLYCYGTALAGFLAERGLSAHLSLTDEVDYVVAFALIEKR
ncbi:holo-ACP synthase [Aromatoleum aromaticum]|uniref:Holo-[acyl-carrier-protein] synthase n=1 Tax=Aromatoleum aromaticum (strain DSM 19018 / LMG 30748 / EbN1) TaxID=76114 RepID=ACPS_AROAE|nr:holo-ACP synthase [Aromatoleum aromaticum]Q5P082.1 RecName: Full=Holo-[acyl-carrier-protein] synthase; Short=Holo-ACP synthase; AltName: Full=4'-phosphopantetheinyl transferase AcpS [Aromatoleum aromaticum EbN1]NMG55397.1 holo-ACP synthase [Aromatoleum aromaticum]CAI09282.1 Phosphopantetheinyl transferase (holo-ACP synthase) [Aromatoleum aromaticum EbN1]